MTLDLMMGIFVWLLGLTVGSFLNVVIYRWPRDLSISRPARSFCPRCGAAIAWYDNIPVLSWLILRAKCRHCREPISSQYPLVEAATGLTFVLLYYLLFIAGARLAPYHLQQPHDWPLLGAWLVLGAAMVACAAMDVAWYMVDIRITNIAIAAGLLLYALWPADQAFVRVGTAPVGAAAVVALIVGAVTAWLINRRAPLPETSADQNDPSPSPGATPARRAELALGALATVLLIALTLWAFSEMTLHRHQPAVQTAPAGNPAAWLNVAGKPAGGIAPQLLVPCVLLALFIVLVLVGGQPRQTDIEVEQALDEERPHARRQALLELAWLAAPLLTGLATLAALTHYPVLEDAWHKAAAWTIGAGFRPLGGVAYSAFGLIVGAAAGWVLRIVFTLIFGREALGSGDIYILAAAGATAGWDIVLLGLLLAVGIALAGYALSLMLKRTLTIPFGPWLALGFVAALWLNQRAADFAQEYYDAIAHCWTHQTSVCWMGAGLMLVGTAGAIGAARLVRRALENQ